MGEAVLEKREGVISQVVAYTHSSSCTHTAREIPSTPPACTNLCALGPLDCNFPSPESDYVGSQAISEKKKQKVW